MVMLVSVGNVWATDFTLSSAAAVTKDGISVSFAKGNGNNAPAWYPAGLRFYASNTITISCDDDITGVTFNWEKQGSKAFASVTANPGSYSHPTAAGEGTWSGSAKSITFTLGSSGQLQLNTFSVTTDGGGSSDPTLTVEPATIDFGTVDQNAIVASKAVAVSFANLTGSVTYSELTSPFSASGTISTTGDEITIEANTATIGEYEQTLTIQSTADSKSQDVTVTMNVVAPFDGLALTFPDYNDKSVSSYTSSWTATKSGQVWTINNFNNNSNGWSLIKAGRSGNASVASITTQVKDHAVSDVTVTIDGVTASKINSHKLYVADNSSFTGAIEITGAPSTIAAGNIVYTVPVVNRANDLYYKLEFDCASGSSNGFLQISKITYAYAAASPQKDPAGLAYDDADLSNLVKLSDAFTAPTLTNPHDLTVAYESSNTDVAEVASNGALTIKAVGVAVITASSEETDTYKAGSAQYALYVVAHEGTEADPYTVADARVVIDKVGETGIADKYATGIVSKIVTALNPTYGNITYDISSDGTTESAQLRAYRGFDKDGAWFTSEDDVLEGDEVVVKGLLKKFDSTYEFDAGNQLVSLNRNKEAAGLAYDITAIEKNIDADAFINLLTNPNGLTVTYSSSDENLAVVDENTGEVLVGSKDGTVTITASTDGDATHLAGTATYTITINDPSLTKVTFDATIDIATDNAEGVTKSGINIITTHTDGENDQHNPISFYQTFKNQTLTVTSTVGNIRKIDFVTTGSSYSANGFAGVANEKWSGDASNIVLTASGNQVRMSKIIVSYVLDTRVEAGLAYAETAIEKEVGDAAFINELTNPNSVDVTYESSNTDVAEVANDGTVTIKAQGIATITATFDGNEDYKPAVVSYTITVNEAGLDNVTFDATIDVAGTNELSITKGGFTLAFTDGAMGNGSEYRLYKNQTMTLSSTAYYIKKIEFTCTSGNPISGFADAEGLDKDNNQWTGQANSVELTASNAQVRIEKLKVYYIEDTRAASGLAWSTDEVEITLGDDFTAASLVNPNNIDAAEITIESSNTNLAIVENGVVSLVEDVTGTATITATFAGNATYKPAEFSYTITVNDPTPMIYVDKLNVNFGTVAKDASVADQTITVTLQNVAAATATLGGTNPEAFSISPASLTESGEVTISFIGSTAAVASFAATLTISDGAEGAEDKTVNLSLSVEEVETPVSTTSEWIAATEIADGVQVLIVSEDNGTFYAMSADRGNNRGVDAGTIEGGVFTPGANTMAFTLVAQDGGTYALRASNGKYLYAGGTGTSNWLNTKAYDGDLDANAKWNIDLANSTIIATSSNRNEMRFNKSNSPKIISCYQSTSTYPTVALYVPKPVKYTVTFNTDGGSTINPVEVEEGQAVAKPEDPTKDDYNFVEWQLNGVAYDFTAAITADITLDAVWEPVTPPTPVYETVREGLTAGNYYTICYPKSMTDVQGATLWSFVGKDANFAYIEQETATTIEAGKPYIMYATASTVTAVLEGDAVEASAIVANGALHGTFSPMDQSALNTAATAAGHDLYLVIGNKLCRATGTGTDNNTLPAQRAYVVLDEIGSAPANMPAHVRSMPLHKDTATGMAELNASETPVKVMINGQMYILRGEKIYDATGRLVK